MDFGLNETQELIRATSAEFLSDRSPMSFVRAMAEDERGFTEEFWREIGELGWLGLVVSEDAGGAGMDMCDMAPLLSEWGAVLAPGPLVESSIVSAAAIDRFGSAEQRQRWLPAISSGESVAVPALSEPGVGSGVLETRASETSDGWVINGKKRFVGYGNSADLLLLPARTEAGVTVFAVPISEVRGTLERERVKMASGVPTLDIEFNEVELPSDSSIGEVVGGDVVLRSMMLHGAVARSLQMAGAGGAVFDRTLDYVKDRQQFGRAIGAFQAIQHYMADMSIKVKSAKHLADKAAWALATDPDSVATSRLVSQAKLGANKLMPEVCWTAHQTHGAIGFTWEHDLHLYTRRVLSWRAEYGDSEDHADRLAQTM